MAAILTLGTANLFAADFGDLLQRLDSRDFSAERDVVTGRGGVYVGELVNPHSETPMFKARDEFRAILTDATQNQKADEIASCRNFITESLNADVSDETKVWLLEQLAVIGVDADVEKVVPLLKSDHRRLVDGAAACLAKIPGDVALKALEDNKDVPAAQAALTCRLAPVFPQDSVETELPLGLSKTSDEKVDEYLKSYDGLEPWLKAEALAGLVARDNKKYRPYALAALNSDDENLKATGFLALEKLAEAQDVDIIVAKLQSDPTLATRIASFIVADGFDDALLDAFDKASDSDMFKRLATVLANRAVDVRPRIFAKTTAKDCPDRLELLKKAREISTSDDVPSFVASIALIPRGKDQDAAENLVASLCNKNAEPIVALFGKVPAEQNEILLRLVARTGGDKAQEFISSLLDSANASDKAAGLRALNVWADGRFTPKMEEILASGQLSEAQQTALLRAYIRTVSLPDDQIGIELSRDEKLAKLQNAFNSAKRPEEKALVLSRVAANRTAKSFEYVVEKASETDPKVVVAAYEAIAAHVHDTILRKENPELAAKGIDIILKNSKDEQLIERVKIYKGRMEQ